MEKKETIGYWIVGIRATQFATFPTSSEFAMDMRKLSMNTSFSYGITPTERLFSCKVEIFVTSDDMPLLKIETQANYLLQEKYFCELIDKKLFTMQESDVEHFTNILYGATRGILLCKLEDTPYKNFIIRTLYCLLSIYIKL